MVARVSSGIPVRFRVGIECKVSRVAEPCDVWTNARSNGSPVGVTPDDCIERTGTAGAQHRGTVFVHDAVVTWAPFPA
jgi:hypothetical protein